MHGADAARLWVQDWHKELALGILDIIDAVESPPAIWWPIHDALEGFSDKVEEVCCVLELDMKDSATK